MVEQMPLGKTPLGGNCSPEMTSLPNWTRASNHWLNSALDVMITKHLV